MIFTFLFLPLLAISSIIQDDVLTTDKIQFSFKEVCQKMVTHESPLIEVVNGNELDCMGKKIQVGEFCDKEMIQDPYYLRAFIDKENKKVICHSGKKVLFQFSCLTPKESKLCNSKPSVSCTEIKNKLAKRLDMVHSSTTMDAKGIKILNCHFESLPLKKRSLGTL